MQIFSIYFWFLVWIFFKFRILIINVISRICAISTLNVVFLLLCTPPFSQIHKFTHKRVWIKTALYNNIFILYIMIKNRTHKDVWKCEKVNFYMHAISLPPLRNHLSASFFSLFCTKIWKTQNVHRTFALWFKKSSLNPHRPFAHPSLILRSSFAHRSLEAKQGLPMNQIYSLSKT